MNWTGTHRWGPGVAETPPYSQGAAWGVPRGGREPLLSQARRGRTPGQQEGVLVTEESLSRQSRTQVKLRDGAAGRICPQGSCIN